METSSSGSRGPKRANIKVTMEGGPPGELFNNLILSWSLDDILNDDLYKDKVKKIPLTFESYQNYLGSFVEPLLENTRSELASSMDIMHTAPRAEVLSFSNTSGCGTFIEVTVGKWKNKQGARGKEPYRTLPGDVLILVEGNPRSVSDLKCVPSWCISVVKEISHDGASNFTAQCSRNLQFEEEMFVIYLMNITTQKRIWKSLGMTTNLNIIEEVIYDDSMEKEDCKLCVVEYIDDEQVFDDLNLNKSQQDAIRASLCKTECRHKSYVDLIWGPPGTGKTKTVGVLLFCLLKMKCRTLLCAPTNFAIRQVASCILKLVNNSSKVSIGDVVLFGNRERLSIGADIEEIYLEHRVEMLSKCLTGWKYWITSMSELLEDPSKHYLLFLEDETQEKSFEDFLHDQFSFLEKTLSKCILELHSILPRSVIQEETLQDMISNLEILRSFESFLQKNLVSEEHLPKWRDEPLLALEKLQLSLEELDLPKSSEKSAIKNYCLERACLVICTTSHSYMLHVVGDMTFHSLVIDEAAQLKEAETTIPLQLPGIKHAILVGDECQLSAMVTSKISAESNFGRSLFGRLSLLKHPKILLNVQYRMHPSISLFPNIKFYGSQIKDAENVKSVTHQKRYLPGSMFGSYSFINVTDGKEEKDDEGRSRMNKVEVAVVVTIVKMLVKEWNYQSCNNKLTVGVVSPYAAQVLHIQEKLADYEKRGGFSLKVKTIDGFQGGEADIIILSTVESNNRGSIGFLTSPQRTNTALTRARYCLWIVGNGRALENNESVWKELVYDARSRGCLFDAADAKYLKNAIIYVKKELQQYEDLVNGNSVLFKNEKWKVVFSDNFRRSFKSLTSNRMKQWVLLCLSKLSQGWRPKSTSVDLPCKSSSQVLKQFKVEGLYVICTNDIIKESHYIQVLKVWDILPLEDIQRFKNRIEKVFAAYTEDFNSLCTTKHSEGDLEVPVSWAATQEIIRFRDLRNPQGEDEGSSDDDDDGITYVENTKLSESLLLMKFYPLSDVVANHLLCEKELDLPIQVTDEQKDIILFPRSSFIIGRSGTGKTTVLTSKLFRKEEIFHSASEGINDDSEDRKPPVLRQLFVTVSSKLCYAVKRYLSHLTSISRGGNSSVDDTHATSDVPNSFINIPKENYPLTITYDKCLMMLDNTLGTPFFERYNRTEKEVKFNRFSSYYWKQFNLRRTKKLDPSKVFTEILSYIKGGLVGRGILSREEYILVSKSRTSSLTATQRDEVYTLFEDYEKLKTDMGEFDLGDLVNDLHRRLESERYKGDMMDFVYIDEVQDLSMRQISLFKYVSKNFEGGFVFAGDTAQTIARGIDFRFQDIRSLFYNEFLIRTGIQEKGNVSDMFQLKQNLRTHSGVLKLAQSVIDILYHYFPHSVDKLDPETSIIFGDAPILLEAGNDVKDALIKIFGDSGERVAFGAEQVILVRDEEVKEEVCRKVDKKALVLTTLECKGLEFRDVLLYKFFGRSSLKDKWRVIYSFMKDKNCLDEDIAGSSFPKFTVADHTALCSELKELYVAITRTRQRLWVCEEKEDLLKSKPIFDYWKKMGLAQIIQLDDSMAKAMQMNSSRQEWLDRGKELFDAGNYLMATLCFEKAKDREWEVRARAYGLRTAAQEVKDLHPEIFVSNLKEAAMMFDSIQEYECVASCNHDLKVENEAKTFKTIGKAKCDASATNPETCVPNLNESTKMFEETGASFNLDSMVEKEGSDCSSNATINWNIVEEIKVVVLENQADVELRKLPVSTYIVEELEKIIKITKIRETQSLYMLDEASIQIGDDMLKLSSLFQPANSMCDYKTLLMICTPLETLERLQAPGGFFERMKEDAKKLHEETQVQSQN